jgi:hypothetical protein
MTTLSDLANRVLGRSRPSTPPPTRSTSSPGAPQPNRPSVDAAVTIEYTPCLDGDPDPGEVVWTWVTYEDDPSQGKDRPVVVIGRRGDHLAGVALTSKRHDREPQVLVGTGSWDAEGRPSYAKVDRLLDIEPRKVRREGAILDRARFDAVVDGIRAANPRAVIRQ